ncbi:MULTISPECIES: translation initiation factor IF-2 [Geobacter]|uniref:translation initiation factor IF-2 n=1 Tax=Geobacter TaxID=28231 RepID=UPI002573131C|nr:translation initiation factor IF-2 [Geobacter sulfurreducens]BEH10430.1 translation initiation factor IF-2 [Geobacter sulfurreducens subsp. ethanolicus]BET57981.1 translation initiation factor IF-2 [Geobacter sp. 60473]HML78393.1 translation initiation factor IF-2 [Geobacter sulfurreducens]
MSKTHVYELAKKMGIENKELLTRLKSLGIEVKNHLSVLEEDEILKVTAPPAAPPKSGPQEEVRVTTTVIRRRRVAEAAPAETPAEAVASPVESAPAPVEDEEAKETVATALPVVEPSVAHEPEAVSAEVPVVAAVEPASEPQVVQKAPVAPAAPLVDDKPTANRARILGRVELPGITTPAPKPADRREATAPKKRIEERIMTPSPTERPAPAGDDRRKAGTPPPPPRKGKEFVAPAEPERGAKKPGGGGAGKKKEAFKKTELLEKRERIFEPGPKTGKGKKREREMVSLGRKTEITVPKAIKRIIKISESITVGELAKRMGIKATDLIRVLMKMGMMVTINHPLDVDTATLVAAEFGYEIENVAIDVDEMLESVPDAPESLRKRPPVVTIMGHVDHGKTSLLDAIREANVIAGEAGGITQHIGAYDVELNGRKITFLDTPGHEAFTAMRARGAKVTDIVILVVAADDGVMPQTREAVNHSKAAGVPIIVAINKIDKPEAKPERVKQELMEFGLVSEEWGGETIFVEVSAKKRVNLPELLEMVLLQADVMDLKANPDKDARGTIVEAKLDRGRGPVATVLVQEGTLKVGDYFVAGVHSGRVRAMQNDRGDKVTEAGPSMPVEVIGFTGVPDAGDVFISLVDEKRAKEIASHRQQKFRETELAKHSKMSLEQLYDKIQKGEVKDLNAIVKADVQGSVEAVSESLRKLSTDAVRLNVIHSSVGAITETDVNLASASNAIILGFNVRPEPKASALAEKEGVDIRLYNIIYDAVEDIKKAMEGLLEPTLREKYLGRAEVREVFSVPKVGNVAGCYVQDGKMIRNAQVRLLRDNVVIYEGKMSSLRRFKDDVKEVATGYECGIGLENYNDIKVGDVIEDFEIEKIATTL